MCSVWISLGSVSRPMIITLVPVSDQDGNDLGIQRFSHLVIITKYWTDILFFQYHLGIYNEDITFFNVSRVWVF